MDDAIVGRIMDKAATADRRALFAALQAALGPIIDGEHGHYRKGGLELVERALDVGAPYGSPEQAAAAAAPNRSSSGEQPPPRHADSGPQGGGTKGGER
jgi:hypothetical protein